MSELKYEARKNRILGIGATIVCTLIIIIFIYFRGKTKFTSLPPSKQEAISQEQIALIDKLNISIGKNNELKRMDIIDRRLRDSTMISEIKLSRKEISKIKFNTNANIQKINSFTDPQLSFAVGNLPRSIR